MIGLSRSALMHLAVAIAALVVVGLLYGAGHRAGSNSVQAEWDAERLSTAAAIQAQTEQARAAEHAAAESIARQKERTDASIHDLNARHRRALDRVRVAAEGGRDLPNRPASGPADCASAGLPERDGVVAVADQQADQRWLLDLARDADLTRAALDACRSWADTVRNLGG